MVQGIPEYAFPEKVFPATEIQSTIFSKN